MRTAGRHLAAWLGLTPREHSSGEIRRLGGISKRGDRHVRMLLTHGERSMLLQAGRMQRLGQDLKLPAALGARAEGPNQPQQGDLRAGQQAGTHRMGDVALWPGFRS